MTSSALFTRCVRHVALLLGSLLLLGGCGGGTKGASQVAVKVNDGEVSVHQLELASQPELAQAPPEMAPEVTRRALDNLVSQELAAQAARKDGLDSDPKVVQLMEAAKREVLARAWQDRQTRDVSEPSTDQVDKYYADHPELFANRRIYSLQEHNAELAAAKVAAVQKRLEDASSLAQATEVLRTEADKVITRNLSAQAEEIPMVVLKKLAELKPGQTVVLPREGGLKALTVVDAVALPVDRTTARRRIASYLMNERKLEVLSRSTKSMREASRIEYIGPYAKFAASAPAR